MNKIDCYPSPYMAQTPCSAPKMEKILPSSLFPAPQQPIASTFRRVFQTSKQMKTEFAKFLNTIFYTLDEKKVFKLMENLLSDPNKSDEQVYKELLNSIHKVHKSFAPLRKLWSLFVLKKGMGRQASALTAGFNKDKFHDYMEVYDRRYVKTIRKAAKMPLDGQIIAVCNQPSAQIEDRIQAGALVTSFPYKTHVALNDADCIHPFAQPEKAYKAIGKSEVADNSVRPHCMPWRASSHSEGARRILYR